MNALVAAVALATLVVGGGSGGALPAASVTVDPPIAVPPQISRINIRVRSTEKLWMVVHVHPGTSRCAATVSAEFERWPDPQGQEIREQFTRAGASLVTVAFHGQPGMYRTCVYFDSDETRNLIVATATFKIRAVNRIMRNGQGLRPWKLGERYVRRAGYKGRYPDTKPVPACRQSFWRRPASMGTGVASTLLGSMVSLPECGRRSAAIAPRMASSSVEPDYAAFVNATPKHQ